MSFFGDLLSSLLRRSSAPAKPANRPTQSAPPAHSPAPTHHTPTPSAGAPEESSPGQFGPSATVEVDPHAVGQVTLTYAPSDDGNPDPGEIVWTWVPFEENDGRGKDRPLVVLAVEPGGSVLAVQLTSKSHDGDNEFVSLGSGPWDAEGRPSWVNLDRVIRVFPEGMRREAAALDQARYDIVKQAVQQRYHWR